MGRGRREKVNHSNFKKLVFFTGGVVLVIIITFIITLIAYNSNLKKNSKSLLTTEKIADLVPNTDSYLTETTNYIEQASTDIGKSIQEVIDEVEVKNNIATSLIEDSNKIKQENSSIEETEETSIIPERIKDPEFSMPVDGEIIRGYAKDSLIYSDTLEEWVTHLGIDIKADRASVVKASEGGTISSIKNDPRYGLTIVIEHANGYRTIYSNLLTTEFVKEGEKVEKGQTIGTVGNSASFEIASEPHLHFEILKDDENLDPNIYLK